MGVGIGADRGHMQPNRAKLGLALALTLGHPSANGLGLSLASGKTNDVYGAVPRTSGSGSGSGSKGRTGGVEITRGNRNAEGGSSERSKLDGEQAWSARAKSVAVCKYRAIQKGGYTQKGTNNRWAGAGQ